MAASVLEPYVPLAISDPSAATWPLEGTVVFADVSGFTELSEKLAEQGKAGAEELTEMLGGTFTALLGEARDEGGDLVSFGGDALFLAFEGTDHAPRAVRAASRLRRALRERGPVSTGRGRVVLRISQGVHTGRFQLVLAGTHQRELLIVGPDATTVAGIEAVASPGQIAISPTTAALLPPATRGATVGSGFLLRRTPPPAPVVTPPSGRSGIDLGPFVPPAVRDRVLAGETDAEHRRVAIGFVHVLGVDDHLRRHGPEAAAAALDAVTSVIGGSADGAGVCLLASDLAPDGAKLILTAGAPTAVEDAEGRLLVALRDALDHDLPLPARAGAHSGHVFASDVGAPWRRVYTVIGDAVNLAARLMGRAEPGEIVASHALSERSATPFATTGVEPFLVKGKRRPQQAVLVGARLGGGGRTTALRAPFVGRQRELAVLGSALASVRDGRGSCIELVGPPGIGKSRLVNELVARAGSIDRVRITCEVFQADVPYYVARLVLRRLLDIPLDADREAAGAALTDRLTSIAPHLVPRAALVGAVIDADVTETDQTARLEPAHRVDALAETVASLLATVATEPWLLVLEDADWMDEASARVVTRLAQDVEHRPWLICTTVREVAAGQSDEPDRLTVPVTRLELEPLGGEVAADLARQLTEDRAISEPDVERLCARAAGNPLYLVELLRAVLETGSWEHLPETLEDILASRIDRLAGPDRRLLRVASVLGDRFDPVLLDEVDGDHDAAWITQGIDRLGDYLTRDGDQVLFVHDLVRQVAYEGLPFARRRTLHRAAATTLAARPGRPDDDVLARIANHWDRAGERKEAWTALLRAAARAQRKDAYVEASILYERALDNGRRTEVSPLQLAVVGERLGDAAELAARFDAATQGYRLARRLLPDDDERQVDLLRKEGIVRERLGRFDAALVWTRRGLQRLGDAGTAEALARRAELEVLYAGVRYRQGKLRNCVTWCERAIRHAEAAGDRRTLANALYVIEGALVDLDDERAAQYAGRSVEIYRELGDALGLGRALMNMGVSADELGRFEEAAELYQQSREELRRAGWTLGIAHVSQNLAEIRSDQGRLDEAEQLLKESRRAASSARYAMLSWVTMQGLGRVAARARRAAEALELLGAARDGFDAIGAATFGAESTAHIAEAHLLAGSPERALEALDGLDRYGDEAVRGSGASPLVARVRGRALAELGRLDEAGTALRRSVDEARTAGAEYDVALSSVEIARLPGIDPDEAREAVERAAAILDRSGVDVRVVCPDPASLPAELLPARRSVALA